MGSLGLLQVGESRARSIRAFLRVIFDMVDSVFLFR